MNKIAARWPVKAVAQFFLNPVILSNQKLLYNALYHAASGTLNELAADSKYLGADLGYIFILHTWGSAMNFHPHIHAIVLGGGLDSSNHWKDNKAALQQRYM